MASKSIDEPGATKGEPESRPSPHDAFFKQTFADVQLAGQFLRERLPPELGALFESVDPIPCETEYVKDNLTKKFADKVLGLPPGDGRNYWLYIVAEAKVKGGPLDLMQLREYCNAIVDQWYSRVLAAQNDSELQRPSVNAPLTVPMIVYSGHSKYNYPTELWELIGPISENLRQYMSVNALLVDLSTIEDNDLSTDKVLRARLRVLKHATDPQLVKNPEQYLPFLLKDVPHLQPPHSWAIIRYIVNLAGKTQVQEALRRIAPKQAEKLMAATDQWIKEEWRAEAEAETQARIKAVRAEVEAETQAKIKAVRAEAVAEAQAEIKAVRAEAEAVRAEAVAESQAEIKAVRAEAVAEAQAEIKAAQDQTKAIEDFLRQTLIVAVEQRAGALSAEARERVATASVATLTGWLSEIFINNSVDSLRNSLLASDSGSHMNGADVPGPAKPPKP